VARATYEWDIRPISTSPAQLPAIHVPWFDSSERRMRDAAIPSIWVAYVGTLVHPSHEKQKTWAQSYLAPAPIAAGLAGFAWTSVMAAFALTHRRRLTSLDEKRTLRALRRAGRAGDEPRFRNALLDLARMDPARWAKAANTPSIREQLALLDQARYARNSGKTPPLNILATLISDRMAELEPVEAREPTRLPSLDAPIAAAGPLG
jgi:hypothetical protein